MKNIQDIREIAENNQNFSLEHYSKEEQAVFQFFKGDSTFLTQIFQDLDPEQTLSIIQSIFKNKEITGESDFTNHIFDLNQIQELLSKRNLSLFISEEEINQIKEYGLSQIPVLLSVQNSSLGLEKSNKNSKISSLFSDRLSKVKGKSKTNLNLRKNTAMLAIAAFGMMASACGAGGIPTAKATYGTLPPSPIVLPITEISGELSMNFANHAAMPDEDDQLSSYSLTEQVLLKLPGIIEKINYQNDAFHPTLTLTANGEYVCSYIWVRAGETNPNALDPAPATKGNYRMHKSCYQEIQGDKDMILMMMNLPKTKTVSLKFQYEK